MLREKFPKMHQSAISASAKDEWGKLPASQKERLNAEARANPTKQKNAHSPPQPPPQPHQNQPPIADQAPTYQMEMVQPPHATFQDVQPTQAPDNQTDQPQQEQLGQTYDFQGAQIQDCTPVNQEPQAVQTALNDPNNFLEEANISQGAQIKDCTSINQELQAVQTAPSGPNLFLEEANISQEAQLQGCTFGDQDLQAPANELPLFSEGDLFDFSLEGIDFDNLYYTGNDGDTTQLEGAPFFL
ncbi:hypothetical protein EKO27_g3227 [Xylaria grammica]|uniref:Uncharacterized protein n=1 Tax=Xylaria grammica TaxID=363999 RepID=A0A439DBU0_9PEZI|nr:hypothetical protein EKO27_g3227 [Xylaria grammica]